MFFDEHQIHQFDNQDYIAIDKLNSRVTTAITKKLAYKLTPVSLGDTVELKKAEKFMVGLYKLLEEGETE